jgi:hypothetical protein
MLHRQHDPSNLIALALTNVTGNHHVPKIICLFAICCGLH